MIAFLAAALAASPPAPPPACPIELVVLGAGQDAGAPQIGNGEDVAWARPEHRLLATSLGLVDRTSGRRYLFEATPDITEQVYALDRMSPSPEDGKLGLDGIFLTHAHMGHYTGLAFLGFESANTKSVPVYAMERMATYLAANGPWSQLIDFGNIAVSILAPGKAAMIDETIAVTPLLVPHRDEYSETVGYGVLTLGASFFFLPDIDSLETWEERGGPPLATLLAAYDHVFLDATFYDDDELGRDMSAIPHPRVKAVMEQLADLPPEDKAKLHFIHYNHSNPIRYEGSKESELVEESGFDVARRGDRICLAGN